MECLFYQLYHKLIFLNLIRMGFHSVFLLSFAALGALGQELEDQRIFAIQNTQDRTVRKYNKTNFIRTFYYIFYVLCKKFFQYLKALNNGEICDRRGDVVTSRNLDQHSKAYRWTHKTLLSGQCQTNNRLFVRSSGLLDLVKNGSFFTASFYILFHQFSLKSFPG